ncbi:MAG: putative ATP-dependent RNA helicase dhr2 [Pleopsidium flavum]|nr:MAG: putative ATP-dependent RNA helicase dhr2 [Pleopsidium flavum]
MPERIYHKFEDKPQPEHGHSNGYTAAANGVPKHTGPQQSVQGQRHKRKRDGTSSPSIQSKQGWRPLARDQASQSWTSAASGNTAAHGQLKEKAKALFSLRRTLPIWSHVDEIKEGLRSKNVMLLVGETGSGKSTQVPQFLVNEPWCKSQTVKVGSGDGEAVQEILVGGCIAITEPRRVAAISLARRVAEEMGSTLGSSSPASKVGYSVRFDNSTSPSTRIKFLTEGMLLQEMLRDPWLRQYSAIIVDEVHERGVNVDIVMGFLRHMLSGNNDGRGGVPLKVAVMSATADMKSLLKFFAQGLIPLNSKAPNGVNGHSTFEFQKTSSNVDARASESQSEWSGISSDDEAPAPNEQHVTSNGNSTIQRFRNTVLPGQPRIGPAPEPGEVKELEDLKSNQISICYIEGRQYPVQISYTAEPVQDFVDAALRTIFQIHYKEPMPGDVLVFLTGQETVEALENLVHEYAQGMGPDVPKLLVLPLFAALPQAAQQRVFQPAPPKTRKVILSTNIAETSVTVSGVRYVIDCGKAKIKQFRTRLGLDSLLVKPISQSAAIQRKGRAGREAPGQCFRLYTEQDYLALQPVNTPEILRCDLSQSILTMKARGINDIMTFPLLDRPPREALEKALLQLLQLEALTESGTISDIGLQIAKLPLSAPLGRVLLAAAEPDTDCLLEVIDITSCISVENIFLNITSEEKKEEAEIARRELYQREGDHLTLLATVQTYAAESADRKSWAERHFVSHRAMQAVMDVRKQLRAQCQRLRLLMPAIEERTSNITSERAVSILKCFLKGFATNTARIVPDGSYRTIVGNQTVAVHPSSGLFGKKVEAIMYNEFVYTNRSYARGVSAVQMNWVGEALAI